MKLYHHKTDGGAEYLTDTFIDCGNGHKEGRVNSDTKYLIRIDGDITKDCELSDKNEKTDKEKEDYLFKIVVRVVNWLGGKETATGEEVANLVMGELIDYK